MPYKDFSYESGERQTAINIKGIRKDHYSRYVYAIEYLQQHAGDLSNARIGDIFCGNGYGTWMIATSINAKKVIGIDGSKDAI
jgi:methylase of polypeptide subunit release factors